MVPSISIIVPTKEKLYTIITVSVVHTPEKPGCIFLMRYYYIFSFFLIPKVVGIYLLLLLLEDDYYDD